MYIDVEGNITAVTIACCFSLSSNFPSSVSVSEDLSSIAVQGYGSGRKRPRPDYDTQSMDISFREPSTKRARRPLSKVASIANLMRDSPLRQAKKSIKRSLSFSRDPVPSPSSKYRLPTTPKNPYAVRRRKKTDTKPHLPQTWVEAVGPAMVEKYSKEEVKRQEVSM